MDDDDRTDEDDFDRLDIPAPQGDPRRLDFPKPVDELDDPTARDRTGVAGTLWGSRRRQQEDDPSRSQEDDPRPPGGFPKPT